MKQREQEAKNIERFSVVKLENGIIGLFERKSLTVITCYNGDLKEGYKVRATDYLEVVAYPVELAKYYIDKEVNKL